MKNELVKLIRTAVFENLIAFIEHANEGIAFIDLNGTICFANSSWAKMHGYAGSIQLTQKNMCIFHRPKETRTTVLPSIEKARQKGSIQANLEHVRADGSAFEALTKIVALNNAQGQTIGFLIFATDLSVNRHHQQSIEALRLANEHLQKQITEMCDKKQSLLQKIDEIKSKSDVLQNEIVDHPHEEAIPIREIPPFDPKKLRALAEMAKRLARKSGN